MKELFCRPLSVHQFPEQFALLTLSEGCPIIGNHHVKMCILLRIPILIQKEIQEDQLIAPFLIQVMTVPGFQILPELLRFRTFGLVNDIGNRSSLFLRPPHHGNILILILLCQSPIAQLQIEVDERENDPGRFRSHDVRLNVHISGIRHPSHILIHLTAGAIKLRIQ